MRTYWPEVTDRPARHKAEPIRRRTHQHQRSAVRGVGRHPRHDGGTRLRHRRVATHEQYGESLAGQVSDRATTACCFYNGWTDLDTLRKLDPVHHFALGDVFRVQAIGYYDDGGPYCRVEAVIDGTRTPSRRPDVARPHRTRPRLPVECTGTRTVIALGLPRP